MKRFIFTHLLTFLAFCAFQTELSAQYTAAGIRFGSPIAASFRFFPGEKSSVEAMLGFRSFSGSNFRFFSVGGLYQLHNDLEIGDFEGLTWYYGGGASIYFWSSSVLSSNQFSSVTPAVHGNIGLDYVFENTPINLSIDWLPTYRIGKGIRSGFIGSWAHLSVRYVISDNR